MVRRSVRRPRPIITYRGFTFELRVNGRRPGLLRGLDTVIEVRDWHGRRTSIRYPFPEAFPERLVSVRGRLDFPGLVSEFGDDIISVVETK
jgi:hypothetical protein